MNRFQLFLFIFFYICCSQTLIAQEEQKTPRKYEIGLNITGTLASFLNTSGIKEGRDPYLLSLRFIKRKNILRFGLATAVEQRKETDPLTFVQRNTKELDFSLRAGIERRIEMAPRFACYWGIDAVFTYRNDAVESFSNFGSVTLDQKQYGVGAGPIFGMRYAIHPRVILTTEAALYGVMEFNNEVQNIPPNTTKTIKNSSFILSPILPSSLYINFLF